MAKIKSFIIETNFFIKNTHNWYYQIHKDPYNKRNTSLMNTIKNKKKMPKLQFYGYLLKETNKI